MKCRLVGEKVSNLEMQVDQLELRAEELQRKQCSDAANIQLSKLKSKDAALRNEIMDLSTKRCVDKFSLPAI